LLVAERKFTCRSTEFNPHVGSEIQICNTDVESAVCREYVNYISISDIVEDPLSWWRENSVSFPYLSSSARVMLSIP